MQAYTHTVIDTCMYAYVYTCRHAYVQTHLHQYTHTHIQVVAGVDLAMGSAVNSAETEVTTLTGAERAQRASRRKRGVERGGKNEGLGDVAVVTHVTVRGQTRATCAAVHDGLMRSHEPGSPGEGDGRAHEKDENEQERGGGGAAAGEACVKWLERLSFRLCAERDAAEDEGEGARGDAVGIAFRVSMHHRTAGSVDPRDVGEAMIAHDAIEAGLQSARRNEPYESGMLLLPLRRGGATGAGVAGTEGNLGAMAGTLKVSWSMQVMSVTKFWQARQAEMKRAARHARLEGPRFHVLKSFAWGGSTGMHSGADSAAKGSGRGERSVWEVRLPPPPSVGRSRLRLGSEVAPVVGMRVREYAGSRISKGRAGTVVSIGHQPPHHNKPQYARGGGLGRWGGAWRGGSVVREEAARACERVARPRPGNKGGAWQLLPLHVTAAAYDCSHLRLLS